MPEGWQGGSPCRRVLQVAGAMFTLIKNPIASMFLNIILSKRVLEYRLLFQQIKDPHSFWEQLSVRFEHHTVFARMFCFFTSCPEEPSAYIPGPGALVLFLTFAHERVGSLVDSCLLGSWQDF